MKESSQTLCFLGAAAAAVAIAVLTRPSDATYEVSDLIGKPLTKAFQAEEAKSLKILAFNEDTATLREFEVAEEGGVWSIPSQGDYPADADQQMAEAATAVMDREILSIVSQSAADHEDYGVVEPSPSLTVGQRGVGKRVTLAKSDGSALVDLIIGKEVKDEPDQRYVRRANQDVVYVVEIDDESLSTKFEDWIEDDLLDLSPWDIQRVQIQDYTAELVMRGFQASINWDRRSDMTLVYDDEDSKWVPGELLAFDGETKDFVPFELTAEEELNADALGDLKSALDDLRIVDVETKPAGLSADLRAGEDFLKNNESVASLVRRGFAPVPMADGQTEILSTEGEVVCSLKTGVEYVLRFGDLQVSEEEATGDAEAEGADKDESSGVNRYLFVSARVNEALVAKPELDDLPELPAGADEAADGGETEEASAAENSTDPEAEADDSTEGASGDDELEALIAERKEIEAKNQSALDEYQSKLKAARERVDALNARFGDWYYVISNEVYTKIRLGRDQVISAKEPEEDSQDPGADSMSGDPLPPGLPSFGIDAGNNVAGDDVSVDNVAADEPTADQDAAVVGETEAVADSTAAESTIDEPAIKESLVEEPPVEESAALDAANAEAQATPAEAPVAVE
ncbi:MAG: DUF4340 domain-containing protein [Planctomycetota bacterium]